MSKYHCKTFLVTLACTRLTCCSAFELYSKTKDDEGKQFDNNDDEGKQSEKKDDTPSAETFKRTFCRSNVHIHFIGVW